MKNAAAEIRHIDSAPSARLVAATAVAAAEQPTTTDAPGDGEQLTLLTVDTDTRARELPSSGAPREVHARFRLSKQTRELGLQHVAAIRRQLEAAKEAREADAARGLPPRRPAA